MDEEFVTVTVPGFLRQVWIMGSDKVCQLELKLYVQDLKRLPK